MLHTLGLVQASAWWKWSRRGVARHRCQHQRLARASQGWAYKLPPSWSTWSRVATIQSYTKYKYKIQNTNTKYKPPTQLVYLIKSGYYTGLHKHKTQTHTLTLQCSTNRKVRYALKEKKRYYLGIFPNMGGGLPKSQNFCKFTKYFFVCQIGPQMAPNGQKHVILIIWDHFGPS